jgi:hypothetical protein
VTDLIERPATLSDGSPDEAGTVSEVCEIVDQLRTDFKPRDTVYEEIDRVVYGEVPIDIPAAYREFAEEVRSPLPLHITNTITAAMTVNPPAVRFRPTRIGDTAQVNATLREHFFDASWIRQEDEADAQLFRKFMHALITKGEGILKTTERAKSAWAGYDSYSKKLLDDIDKGEYKGLSPSEKDALYHGKTEEYKRGRASYPICTTDVPPECFYYLRGSHGLTCVAEVKRVPYYETLAQYEMGLDRGGKVVPMASGQAAPTQDWHRVMSKTRSLLMVEFWTRKECVYLLVGPGDVSSGSNQLGRGKMVKRFKHGYADPVTGALRGPYFQAMGITTSSRQVDKTGLSVIYGFLPLFPLLDRLLTARGANAEMTMYAAFQRTTPDGGGLSDPTGYGSDGTPKQREPVKVVPGEILPFGVGPVEMPEAGREVDKMIQATRDMIELALPSVVQGIVDTTNSGYQLNQEVHLARLAWSPIVANAERALGRRVGFESWLIENRIMESVAVWGEPAKKGRKSADAGWLSLGPDDLDGVHRYEVRLNPETPSNRVIDVRTHAEMVGQGFETRAMAIEELGLNPDEVERGLLLEQLKQDPVVLDRLKQRVFQGLGLADQRALEGADQRAGLPPGQPDPGAALQGMGDVFMPGQAGQPLVPTVPGVQPGLPAAPPGMPGGVQGPPAAAFPLPGQ